MADELTSLDTPSHTLAGIGDATNLYGVIDKDHVHGLNLAIPEDAKEIIKPWDERESTVKYVDSGVDDQMIIHIPFTQNVLIRSILLKLGRGETFPHHLRVFANHPTGIDFSDAESITPQMDISLLDGQDTVTEYPLRVAVFANVFSLSLFFSETNGEEVSRVYYIGFKGETRSPRKDVSTTLEVPAAHAADAPVSSIAEKATGRQSTIR